jgi:hypothetical protein
MVPSDNPALWMFASSCIQFGVLLHLVMVMGQVHSFSGKKGDVSFLITKAKAKCRSLERHLQRTPVPPAADGAWINAAEFFDWHGCPQDVDPEVYQDLSASVYDALVYCIDVRLVELLGWRLSTYSQAPSQEQPASPPVCSLRHVALAAASCVPIPAIVAVCFPSQ